MNVDVEIYMSNLIKFFKENEKDLLNLVPKEKEEEFYKKIRQIATHNSEKGEDASLTRQQLIDVCLELNGNKSIEQKNIIIPTIFGEYSLN